MPTPGGLPQRGEIWKLELPTARPRKVVVISRGAGDYWSLYVAAGLADGGWRRTVWVDPSYWLARGWLTYDGEAGPQTRAALGL